MFHPFFSEDFPKSTGPELFNMEYLNSAISEVAVQEFEPEDLIATVTQFTAQAIAMSIKTCADNSFADLFVSGGGSHNKFLLEKISELLPDITIKEMDDLGISADAKEAVLFAVLANETVCGSAIEAGGGPAVMMGKISLPG
jgi:anhydro-N-acetylmuramic acid kinase